MTILSIRFYIQDDELFLYEMLRFLFWLLIQLVRESSRGLCQIVSDKHIFAYVCCSNIISYDIIYARFVT